MAEAAAGLFVLEGAGQEHGHVDVLGEQRRVVPVAELLGVVIEAEGQLGHVDVLAAQLLVLLTDRVALVDESLLPTLAVGLGLGQDLIGPGEGESLVEEATR